MKFSKILPHYLLPCAQHETLNKMQSECLEAWNNDENLLISAPTGAGKTICFELAILRVMNKAMQSRGEECLSSAGLNEKIVYIAPTKSLCLERADDWQKKFARLGLRVSPVTGDGISMSFGAIFRGTDLVITTPEKWDSVTRSVKSNIPDDAISQVTLLLLDEVHQLGDPRGGAFEAVVTRMLTAHHCYADQIPGEVDICRKPKLRIIGVSATILNVGDVGRWLGVSSANIKVFDDTYRPVALNSHVLGYSARNQWLLAKTYDKDMLKIVLQYGDGKPSLVFCPTRKQTVASARALVQSLVSDKVQKHRQRSMFLNALSTEQQSTLIRCAEESNHFLLKLSLPHGIAIHNADMNQKTRKLVESLFRDSLITCLFSTSTLAQGVNLPARLVIVAGTTVYNGSSLQEYEPNLVLQMCGRAGRAGLDSKGVAVIMTQRSSVNRYNELRQGPSILQSQLVARLEEYVNAETARHAITDLPGVITYLSNTFFWIQSKTELEKTSCQNDTLHVRRLHGTAVQTVDKLCSAKLLQYDDDGYGLSNTSAGILMANHCLSFQAMSFLKDEIPGATTPSQVLRTIALCPDSFAAVCLRRSEKKRLNKMNESIRMPICGKVRNVTDKIVILLQLVMGEHRNGSRSDPGLYNEAQKLFQPVARVARCLIAMVLRGLLPVPYDSARAVLLTCRGLQNRCLWDGPSILKQVPGISLSDLKALTQGGISTLAELSVATAEKLDQTLRCRSVFASNIDQSMKTFPRFAVYAELLSEVENAKGMTVVQVKVEVSSMKEGCKPRQPHRANVFIMIGSRWHGLLACHVFALTDCYGHVTCEIKPLDGKASQHCVEVLVGCDNLCGTDVLKRISIDRKNHNEPLSQYPSKLVSMRQKNRRLSIEKGKSASRLTEKKREVCADTVPIPTDAPLRESLASAGIQTCKVKSASRTVDTTTTWKGETSKTLLREVSQLANIEKDAGLQLKKQKVSIQSRPDKQFPVRLEPLVAVAHVSGQQDGREYDEVFRSIF